jgi:DNA polymerase IV
MNWVLHVDLDQFLAAVEKRRRPEVRAVPVVVGGSGDPTKARQVVACASYEARAFGVHAGMPLRAAFRKCPEAVFLPSDAPAYDEASAEVMGILRSFDLPVQVLGWDEAFAGAVTPDPERLAEDIRAAISTRAGLVCSVGIGDNMLRAKIATGFAKPAGVYRITAANWSELMAHRSTEALWGIGKRTGKRLAGLGISTVDDLARAEPTLLAKEFGPRIGPWLGRLGQGISGAEIDTTPREATSRSHSTTFAHDLTDRTDIDAELTTLARRVAAEVVDDRPAARVAVTVRTASFYTRTKIRKLASPTSSTDDIVNAALAVLDLFPLDRPVRLLGVRVEFAHKP